MAILVCGGAGYIGSHTVYQLVKAGAEVVIVDNFQTGHRGAINPAAKFYQGDIRAAQATLLNLSPLVIKQNPF